MYRSGVRITHPAPFCCLAFPLIVFHMFCSGLFSDCSDRRVGKAQNLSATIQNAAETTIYGAEAGLSALRALSPRAERRNPVQGRSRAPLVRRQYRFRAKQGVGGLQNF